MEQSYLYHLGQVYTNILVPHLIRNNFGKARYIALKDIEGHFDKNNLEEGSIVSINFVYYNKKHIVMVEILDEEIVQTIPKSTDLIKKAIDNNKKRLPSIASSTEAIHRQSSQRGEKSRHQFTGDEPDSIEEQHTGTFG